MIRKARETAAPPAQLLAFSPPDWKWAVKGAFDAWKSARRDFAAENPGAFGDAVEMIQTERAQRRRVAAEVD